MFVLILALLGAAGAFFFASATQNWGWYMSYQLCRQGTVFCDHPGWLMTAAGVAIVIEMIRTMSKA